MKRIMILCAAASLLAAGCAKQKHVGLRDDADSVAYIIGMNVGMNLLRMDSTLRADVVCEGLRDAMRGATRMTRGGGPRLLPALCGLRAAREGPVPTKSAFWRRYARTTARTPARRRA